jgi:hypothetical protein
VSDYCIHDFPKGQCGYCVEIPFGINNVGYKTQFGNAFHNWNNCEYLVSGQEFAVSRGGNATEISTITWSASLQNLYPCEWCCALFYSKGKDLADCLVTTPNGEVPAKIIKDRYMGKNMREFQIYFPDSGDVEVLTSRYVKKF